VDSVSRVPNVSPGLTRDTVRGGDVTGGRTVAGGAWVAGETAGGRNYVHGRTGDGDRFAVGQGANGEIYARAKGDYNGGIVDLPGDSVAVIVGGGRYYRHGYDYYWPYYYGGNTYYQEVYAPTGAVYETIPAECGALQIGEQVYYVYDDVYYQKVGEQYVVVDLPARPSDAPVAMGDDVNLILKRMDERVAALPKFVMDFTQTATEASGTPPQISKRRAYGIRPNRMAARELDGADKRQFVYNGKTLSVFDPERNVYGVIEVPGTLAEATIFLRENYGVQLPLGELLNAELGHVIRSEATTVTLEGREKIEGSECVKVVFLTPEVRGTLWVDADEAIALPRRMELNYIAHPDQPKYEVTITRWQNVDSDENLFTFTPPEGANRIDIVPRAGAGSAQ
jgi:hypothetical protein